MVDVFASLPGRELRRSRAPGRRRLSRRPSGRFPESSTSTRPPRPARHFSSCASGSGRIRTARSSGSAPSSTRSPTRGRGTCRRRSSKPRSIDDVPIWALTFWSPTQDPATLRQIAAEVENEIKTIPEVSDTALIGGLRREFRVELDPARLSARGPLSRLGPRGDRRGATGGPWPASSSPRTAASSSRRAASSKARARARGGRRRRAGREAGAPLRGRVDRRRAGTPASYVTHGEPGRNRAASRPSRSPSASAGERTRSRSCTRSTASSRRFDRGSWPPTSGRRSRGTTARPPRRSRTSS